MSNATKTSNKAGLHCELSQLQMALAAGLCIAGASAFAQETATLPTVTVHESAAPSVKVDVAPSSKFTAPLIDTPKTVTVINEEVFKQTGATSLQDALKATPGITFGNGEGGNPTGDQPFIRGSDAQSSTFVDGMRDIAAGTREVFNLESVEVIKGADSAYAGRGGAGGSINLSTKKAKNENFVSGDVGLGTDKYKRTTLDLNRKINETTGLRLNAMAHDADVAGRKGPENKRWGIAPTVTFGMGTPTEVTLSWQHLQTNNIPDGGVPYLYKSANAPAGTFNRPTYGGNRNNWYGLLSRDFEKEKSDLVTVAVEHKFTETNKFRNSLRHSKSTQEYLWTQPDDSQGNVIGGNVYQRVNARQAQVETIQNVSEFTGKQHTGSLVHDYAFGLELSKEKSNSRGATGSASASASCAVAAWCTSLGNPNNSQPSPATYVWNGDDKSTINQITTTALYGFDTIKFNQQWLANVGLRLDHYDLKASGPGSTGGSGGVYPAYNRSLSDTLLNYQLGLVYKPADNGSIYVNYGTSSRPGGASLGNGDEDLAITKDAFAELEPEKTRSIELGTKWDLLGKQLGLNAAIFRNEVTNVRITDATGTYMAGSKVVNGLELGFTGNILRNWSVFGGYTFMDSKRKNTGSSTVMEGKPFTNTPKHSLSLWTSYKPNQKLTLGLGAYAQSMVYQGFTAVSGGVVSKGASGYARYDAMASYQFNPNLALQVNVYNLTDKVYFSGVRSTHYATMAPGRSAVATLKFTY